MVTQHILMLSSVIMITSTLTAVALALAESVAVIISILVAVLLWVKIDRRWWVLLCTMRGGSFYSYPFFV